MRHPRSWLALGAALLLVVLAVIVSLPVIARWAAVRRLEALTGRPVTIADVDLNLFTRRLAVVDLRVAGRAGGPPLLVVPRVDIAFRLLPLFAGRAHLVRLSAAGAAVVMTRMPDGTLSIEDVVERLRSRSPDGLLTFTIDDGRLAGGRIVLEDGALSPSRRWQARNVRLELHEIGAGAGGRGGTARLRFDLGGAPVDVQADQIRVRPAHARATLTASELDLSPVTQYVPADAPVRPAAGRFTTRVRAEYDASDGLRAAADSVIHGLVLMRAGQDEPFVSTPALTIASRDVRYRDGTVRVGRIEVQGSPSVLDASVEPAQRHDVQNVHLVAEELSYPGGERGRVALTMALAGGGSLAARGGLAVHPVAADLTVTVADLDLARLGAYLPADAPVRLAAGVGSAALDVRYAADPGLRLAGDVTLRRFVLAGAAQRAPVITHRELRASVADLRLRRGGVAVDRVTVTGAPTIVDASVSPPQRLDVAALSLTVRDLAWPAARPAGVEGRARLAAGAAAALGGTFHPGTLEADVRATFSDVDIGRFAGYLAPDTTIHPAGGVASADVRVRHRRGEGLRIDGTAVVRDAALAREGEAEPVLAVSALELGVQGLSIGDGAITLRRARLDGAPTIRVGDASPPLRVPGMSVTVEDVTWPERDPARLVVEARLPRGGIATARGHVRLAGRSAALEVDVSNAALGPYAPLLGVTARVDGRLRASLRMTASVDPTVRLEVTGRLAARDLALGPSEQPLATVEHVELSGVHARWPEGVEVERVAVTRPSVLVEREHDGSFPLRAVLGPVDATDSDGATTDETPAAASPRDDGGASLRIAASEIRVVDGDARFIDRTTRPFYSEEVTRLTVEVKGFTTEPGAVAHVALQGIVGADAAFDLEGRTAPFGESLVLDVAGEVRDFSVPRTNPYLRHFLDWIARRGELTTRVRYHIEGRELTGSNDIVVERLDMAPAGPNPDKLVGLPLGLVVSLLKNSRGDIRLSVPVSGDLASPTFSFGDALRTALRNVLTRLVAGPIQAIGRVFTREGEIEAVAVDPVIFEPGSAVVRPDGTRQVRRVADFLRSSPYVHLTVTPVVTPADRKALKAQAVTARVQRLQREAKLPDFAAAARALFHARFPDRPVPGEIDRIVSALRDTEPVAEEATRQLAERRLRSIRRALTEAAGIDAARVHEAAHRPEADTAGQPRVTFELVPAG